MSTTNEKIQEIQTKIKELTALISNKKNSKLKRRDWTRSRTAYKANLTRLQDKANGRGKPAVAPAVAAPVVETDSNHGTSVALIDSDKDQNVIIKSAVTAASLGWAPYTAPKEPERPFKKEVYYDVLAVHSRTNYTS